MHRYNSIGMQFNRLALFCIFILEKINRDEKKAMAKHRWSNRPPLSEPAVCSLNTANYYKPTRLGAICSRVVCLKLTVSRQNYQRGTMCCVCTEKNPIFPHPGPLLAASPIQLFQFAVIFPVCLLLCWLLILVMHAAHTSANQTRYLFDFCCAVHSLDFLV